MVIGSYSMKKPNIWLESTHTLSSRGRGRTGVGHYTEELISHLTAAHPDTNYTVVGNVFASAEPSYPKLQSQNVKFRLCRLFPGKVWNQLFKRGLMLPLNWLIPGRPDLVVLFNFVRYPVTPGVKTMTTIHDLTFHFFPETVQDRNRRYLKRFVPKAIRQCDQLIAVSEATKQDMVKIYGVDPTKVSVVHPGVDLEAFKPTPLTSEARQRLNLPEKYFLFVSTLEPRKNLPRIMDAYRALPDAIKREYALVLTGGMGWLADDIKASIQQGDPVGRIIKTNYVPQEDLPMLFTGASAFVFPSLYEGFGMPALEAMACGTPVVTSNVSSMPETVGEAAISVDPLDITAITKGMEQLVTDSSLHAKYRELGLKQAQKFTWKSSAAELDVAISKVFR
jgi:glycosyltransferase involved in cell wall biosynthesis